MKSAANREKLIRDIERMPADKVKEVVNFVNYLNLKEDAGFIALVNRRTKEAEADKRAGRKFTTLSELQKKYT